VLLRGTAIVSVLTLLSRLLGFVRDLLVARLLGASLFADAFFVAFRIPNLLRSFVAEGALTSAFTPVFSTSLKEGKDAARATVSRIIGFLLIVTTVLTLGLIIFAPNVIDLIAPGFRGEGSKFELCIELTRLMAPYIICVSLIALLNSALNALNIFGASAWAQVVMNLVLIAGAILASPFDLSNATLILALSVLLGGFVQVATQVPACKKSGLSLRPSFKMLSRDVADVVKLMIPATLGASIYQITIFMSTVLASLLPSGSVSWLFYADRVAQFPIGVFSIALASVLLPALSNASARSDESAFSRNLGNSLRYTSFCIIPMSIGIWALALPITSLLFERGAFDAVSSGKTAQALQALCFGLWASSCYSMLARAFIAKRDTLTPSLIGIASLLVNLIASLVLMGPFADYGDTGLITGSLVKLQIITRYILPINLQLGHAGLALASSIAAVVSMILALFLFGAKIGTFPWRDFIVASLKSIFASACMALAIALFRGFWQTPLLACIMGILIGVATFLVVSFLIGSRELKESWNVIRTRLNR
jgi:putative peptidoglycan lipid II flippase